MKYVKHQYLWNSRWPDIFEIGERENLILATHNTHNTINTS